LKKEEHSKFKVWKHISHEALHAPTLKRDVDIHVYMPTETQLNKKLPLLIFNDGQDLLKMNIPSMLTELNKAGKIDEFILVGITCGERTQEYGVANHPDYKGRGKRAFIYSKWLTEQLIPWLESIYPIQSSHNKNGVAGFSLGGLSALDMTLNYPEIFSFSGAFSGSFWWRKKDLNDGYTDADRIMHARIKKIDKKDGLRFWFQAGTDDERADRNQNGIIDAIDDTLDIIAALHCKGYKPYYDTSYYEMKGGRHDVPTWAEAMPHFLIWAYPKS